MQKPTNQKNPLLSLEKKKKKDLKYIFFKYM